MKQHIFGIDVGGTSAKIGFFTSDGTLLDKWEMPTGSEAGARESLQLMADALTRHLEKKSLTLSDLIGVGVDVPGPVLEDGSVKGFANLNWGHVNVKELFSELLGGVPVCVGNDANVAALGEMWKGAAAGCRSLVMVTLGTGVGGGVIIDQKIVTGAHGAGGEIGHMHVNHEETDRCGCGNTGCLEQYASATGLVRITKKRLAAENHPPSVLTLSKEMDAKVILDAAKKGDALALESMHTMCAYLGRALAAVASVADPEIFVIGGGVSRAGDILIETISRYYKEAAFFASRDIRICPALLGNDGGMYGAARMLLT